MDPTSDTAQQPPQQPHARTALQPGQLSKPEKVWVSATALVIGFYQAAPYSDAIKILYKKSGAIFGTQVALTPASILGPELAVRQPVQGEAQYFEYEIKKLKPSTQYVVKIKTGDEECEVRSDTMGTLSLEEERSRDNDMRNFVGALVKVGEYDGLVVSYNPAMGIYGIRILQIDNVAASLQLARLTSDYSDNGVPVQAYTLSQIRFSRWGGAITGSKVVHEGELRWLVARAVQMTEKSDAAAAFEARQRVLQAQVERVAVSLELEWSTRFRSLRLRALVCLVVLALVVVAGGGGMAVVLQRSARRQRQLEGQVEAYGKQHADLEAELRMLHLYRVSLEFDVERRVLAAEAGRAAGTGGDLKQGGVSAGAASKDRQYGSDGWCGMHDLYGNATDGMDGAASGYHGHGNMCTAGGGAGRDGALGVVAVKDKGRSQGLERPQEQSGVSGGGGRQGEDRELGDDEPAARKLGGKGAGGGGGRGAGRAAAAAAAAASSASGRHAGRESRVGKGSDGDAVARGDQSSGQNQGCEVRKHRGDGGEGSGHRRRRCRRTDSAREGDDGSGRVGASDGGDGTGVAHLWGMPGRALRLAWARSHSRRGAEDVRREWLAESALYGSFVDEQEQPDAWAFIQYVSREYALHLQEWMKVQLQKGVRQRVNEMLTVPEPGQSDNIEKGPKREAREGDRAAEAGGNSNDINAGHERCGRAMHNDDTYNGDFDDARSGDHNEYEDHNR